MKWEDAEAGEEIESMRSQLPEGVVGVAVATRIMPDGDRGEARSAPRQEDIDGDEVPAVVGEAVSDARPKRSKSADVPRDTVAHRTPKGDLGQARREIPPNFVRLLQRLSVHDVVASSESLEEFRNLRGWVLKIIIQRDDDRSVRRANSAEKGGMLPKIPGQIDSPNPGMAVRRLENLLPAGVEASIIDQDELECG